MHPPNQNIPQGQVNPYGRNLPPHQNNIQPNYGNNFNNQNNGWNQPPPQQNQPQIHHHPYRNEPQVNVVNHNMNGGFCFNRRKLGILFIFLLIGFGISLYFVVSTNTCEFYGRYPCFYSDIYEYECCTYMCPTYWYDPDCKSFTELQGPFLVFYVLTSVLGVSMVILAIRMCMVRMRRNNNVNVYVRQWEWLIIDWIVITYKSKKLILNLFMIIIITNKALWDVELYAEILPLLLKPSNNHKSD